MKSINPACVAIAMPVLFIILASGCVDPTDTWSITINNDNSKCINSSAYSSLMNCNQTYDGVTGIPLEIFLYYNGVYPVESISFGGTDYNWRTVAYNADKEIPMLVLPDGSIYYNGSSCRITNINVTTTRKPDTTTLEVYSSILYALGAGGEEKLIHGHTDCVVLFYIDGVGYQRLLDGEAGGLTYNISSLGNPIQAINVYPSISRVNSKSLVTGKSPDIISGNFRSMMPDNQTIFDILSSKGIRAIWIDGTTAPVYLEGYTRYNLDRNGDGSTEDEVIDDAIEQYRSGAGLLVVHLKSTDSEMHDHGPDSEESRESLKHADEYIGKVLGHLEPRTTVIIYSDHGGHDTIGGGNHGTLLPDDMIVPVFVHII